MINYDNEKRGFTKLNKYSFIRFIKFLTINELIQFNNLNHEIRYRIICNSKIFKIYSNSINLIKREIKQTNSSLIKHFFQNNCRKINQYINCSVYGVTISNRNKITYLMSMIILKILKLYKLIEFPSEENKLEEIICKNIKDPLLMKNIKLLNLKDLNLGDETFKVLSCLMRYSNEIQSLSLSNNNITSTKAISDIILFSNSLLYLDLSYNPITGETVINILDCYKNKKSNLPLLLELTGCSFNNNTAKIMGDYLKENIYLKIIFDYSTKMNLEANKFRK